jgi:hypothetical protein
LKADSPVLHGRSQAKDNREDDLNLKYILGRASSSDGANSKQIPAPGTQSTEE